jgi:hypothetical protein
VLALVRYLLFKDSDSLFDLKHGCLVFAKSMLINVARTGLIS